MNMKTANPKLPTIQSIRALLIALKPDIGDDFRCTDDRDDTTPGMLVTIGADGKGRASWSYQTGDNSFTGGAYGYPHWALVYLYRNSNCTELAKDAIDELHNSISW